MQSTLVTDQLEALWALVRAQYPGAQLVPQENGQALITVHALGANELTTLQQAVNDYVHMKNAAENLDQMIDDAMNNLADRGMSRQRHDEILEILNDSERALADGIMIGLIQPLRVPYYTRTIEDLRRRTETRLMMIAQEMAEQEKAKKRAAQKFTHTPHGPMPYGEQLEPLPGEGAIAFALRKQGL